MQDDPSNDVGRSHIGVELRLTFGPRNAAWDALWRKLFHEVLLENAPGVATDAGEVREAA